MAEEKTPRHKKAYKDSPTLKRDQESGKMGVSRGEKKAAQDNSGTDGMPEHDKMAMEMGHKHEKEHLDLNQKHEKERHSLRSKHMMDMAGEKKESEGSGAGKEKIEKTEDKGEE